MPPTNPAASLIAQLQSAPGLAPDAAPSPELAMAEDGRECPIQEGVEAGQDSRNSATDSGLDAESDVRSQDDVTETGHFDPSGGQNAPLFAKRLHALDLLLQGYSFARVAELAHISLRTLYRWRQDPLFDQELAQRRQELHQATQDRLTTLTSNALDLLAESVNGHWRPELRLQAAALLLRLSLSRPNQPSPSPAAPPDPAPLAQPHPRKATTAAPHNRPAKPAKHRPAKKSVARTAKHRAPQQPPAHGRRADEAAPAITSPTSPPPPPPAPDPGAGSRPAPQGPDLIYRVNRNLIG